MNFVLCFVLHARKHLKTSTNKKFISYMDEKLYFRCTNVSKTTSIYKERYVVFSSSGIKEDSYDGIFIPS